MRLTTFATISLSLLCGLQLQAVAMEPSFRYSEIKYGEWHKIVSKALFPAEQEPWNILASAEPGGGNAGGDYALDENGDFYVSDTSRNRILRFSDKGQALEILTSDALFRPDRISIAADGTFFVRSSLGPNAEAHARTVMMDPKNPAGAGRLVYPDTEALKQHGVVLSTDRPTFLPFGATELIYTRGHKEGIGRCCLVFDRSMQFLAATLSHTADRNGRVYIEAQEFESAFQDTGEQRTLPKSQVAVRSLQGEELGRFTAPGHPRILLGGVYWEGKRAGAHIRNGQVLAMGPVTAFRRYNLDGEVVHVIEYDGLKGRWAATPDGQRLYDVEWRNDPEAGEMGQSLWVRRAHIVDKEGYPPPGDFNPAGGLPEGYPTRAELGITFHPKEDKAEK